MRRSTGASEEPGASGARDRSSSSDAQMGSQRDPGALTQPPAAGRTHTCAGLGRWVETRG